MHRAKLKRLVACVLAFVIFLTGSQFDLFAHAAGDPPYIKKELEQYRTEFSKTYLKSDGGLESVVSPSALHFKNEKGEWEEIDQTLVLKTEDGQKVYETKNSPMTVRFPAELNSSDTGVTLEAEGHKIVVELLDNKNSKASKKEEEKQSERSGRPKSKMIASELLEQEVTDSSAIEYADVYSGADLRYDTTAGILKESVIIKNRQNGNRTYRYNITADGLELRLESDGRVEFYEPSSAEPVFTMPAPLMFDAKEEYSYDIDVKLKQKKGAYELSYTPDKDWLNDQERIYPVTLDPSIVVNSGVEDSYTYSAADYQNSYLGFEKQLKVGGSVWQGSNDTFDTYIKFKELPQIPAEEYTLDSALLMVTPKSFAGYWSEMKVGAFEITEDWTNEYTGQSGDFISYANRPASSEMTFSTATFTYGDTAAGGFEVANLVEKWYNEAGTNYGVRLSAVSATDNPWNCLIFHSSRSDTGRPYLSITYTPIIEATGITITNRPENDCVELMSSLPSYKLEAELSPEEATPEEIVWESSDTEVADIAADGRVWPHKTGTTIISVKLKDRQEIRDSFALSFYNTPVESLTIKGRPSDDTITRTYTLKLTADIYPLNASVDKIEWSSSDPSVATVDGNGLCTGVSGGTTTITAKAGSVTDSFLLTVKRTSVIVVNGPSGWEMIEGQTFEHFLTQTWPLTDDEIVYTSSDPSVATVNGKIIKALKAGTTTIRAELANDSSIYVEEELLVKPGGYKLNLPPNNYLVVGQSWKLTDDPDVKIEVGNQPKIKVESGGIITAVESGETTLETWKGYRGDFRRIELVIGLSDLGITGRPSNDRMEVGDIHQGLSVSISNPYDEDIVWSTSDESVATVDCDFLNGTRIYAHNEGVTIISAYIPEINTSASFTLTVSPKEVNSVVIHDDFKPENDTIYLSEEITLGAQVTPADATYDKVDWSTQSINGGLVYTYPTYGTNARRTIKVSGQHTGQVKFTAYAGGVSSAPYTITIKELEAEITNLPAGNKMTVGQTHQLGKIVGPSDAKVHWNVANDNIATIDQNGKITALAPGSTAVWIEVSKFEVTETAAFTLTVESLNITNRPANNTLIVGQTHTVSKNPSNASITWKSSEPNIATIDQNGKITAKLAGTTKISAISGNKSVSFDLNVTRTITGDDVYITDQTTKDSIILYKNLVDAVELAYLSGKISQEEKELHQSSLNNSADIARADYVILNPESNFVYQYFKNRNYTKGDSTPFTRDLYYDSQKPLQGLDVIIVQRALELYSFLEPPINYVYGTFDQMTLDALYESQYDDPSTRKFSAASYKSILGPDTEHLRTISSIQLLQELRTIHNAVVDRVGKKVQGDTNVTIPGAGLKKDHSTPGYADVIKTTPERTYIWEVKPWGDRYRLPNGIAVRQINRYIEGWNRNYPNNPAVYGYYIGKFAFDYLGDAIIVESNPAPSIDPRSGLVHYKKVSDAEYSAVYAYDYVMEDEPVIVPEPVYTFGYSYSFQQAFIIGLVFTSTILVSVVIAGVAYTLPVSTAAGVGGMMLQLAPTGS